MWVCQFLALTNIHYTKCPMPKAMLKKEVKDIYTISAERPKDNNLLQRGFK